MTALRAEIADNLETLGWRRYVDGDKAGAERLIASAETLRWINGDPPTIDEYNDAVDERDRLRAFASGVLDIWGEVDERADKLQRAVEKASRAADDREHELEQHVALYLAEIEAYASMFARIERLASEHDISEAY